MPSQVLEPDGRRDQVVPDERTGETAKVTGPALAIYLLWTVTGTGVYLIDTTLLNTSSPRPAQASLTLKLIARVRALR